MFNIVQPLGVPTMHRPSERSPFDRPTSISVVEGPPLRSGTRTVIGYMPAGIMIPGRFEVPYYDTRTKRGYQRAPQEARIRQLAADLRRDRTDLPTAVLLNLRNREAREAVTEGSLDLTRLDAIETPVPFFVVDGQHRIIALRQLIEEEPDRWSHFQIPFVCLIGANEAEEMEQFYIVNSTAKSVRTDLALTLLKRRADSNDDVLLSLQEKGKAWQVEAQEIVEHLSAHSNIWKPSIRLASMEKGETTISSASMVTSLQPLFASPYFDALKLDQKLKLIEAYWAGLREIIPQAFHVPKEYSLQKGVGVIVLHSLMPSVMEIVRSRGDSPADPQAYVSVMKDAMLNLEGENASGNPVGGADFWAAAPVGGAGGYSSSAGRRVLIAKMRQLLPEIEVE